MEADFFPILRLFSSLSGSKVLFAIEIIVIAFHCPSEKRRAAKKTMSSICRNSDLYQNMTLVGGSKAGLFTDLGRTYDMRACQERYECTHLDSRNIIHSSLVDGRLILHYDKNIGH